VFGADRFLSYSNFKDRTQTLPYLTFIIKFAVEKVDPIGAMRTCMLLSDILYHLALSFHIVSRLGPALQNSFWNCRTSESKGRRQRVPCPLKFSPIRKEDAKKHKQT
jgi:hypothetical protein